MGSTLAFFVLGFFALAIIQSFVRRVNNPFEEVAFASLPAEFQSEMARVLPDFTPGRARMTRKRDEVRVDGQSAGRSMQAEAQFDDHGALVEFEAEAAGGMRTLEKLTRDAIPSAATAEIDRVLGDPAPVFDRTVFKRGTVGDQPHFEFKGYTGDWKWEIVVSADGRLHELEKELLATRG